MVYLTPSEISWLDKHYPDFSYDIRDNTIKGILRFCCSYNGIIISDSYNLKICLSTMNERCFELPKVFDIDKKAHLIALQKGLGDNSLHLNADGSFCLIFPLKIARYYPNGFELERFFLHLQSHCYWLSYFERYGKEPWPGEKHGIEDALADNINDPLFVIGLRPILEKEMNRELTIQEIEDEVRRFKTKKKFKI